jgi:Protein of unknown function (DUF3237)
LTVPDQHSKETVNDERRAVVAALSTLAIVGSPMMSTESKSTETEKMPDVPLEVPGIEYLFQARCTISAPIELGNLSYGKRRIIPITGGIFEGPKLRGTILPGGEDTQLVRPDGCLEIVARYVLKTHDGVPIYVINSGLIFRPEKQGDGAAAPYIRTLPKFEAPLGSAYEWLNRAVYVGTLTPLTPPGSAVLLRYFKVT